MEECERLEQEVAHIADRILADESRVEYKGMICTDVLDDKR